MQIIGPRPTYEQQSMWWLVGHTLVGGIVLIVVLASLGATVGGLLYLTVGASALAVDARYVPGDARRARTLPRRVGWSLLLPLYALGMVLHGVLDLAN